MDQLDNQGEQHPQLPQPQQQQQPGPAAPPPPPPPPNLNIAAVDVVKTNTHFKIPEYSGHAKGTVFQGTTGPRTELLSVQAFTRQVEYIKGAAKWDDKVTAQYVKLSFLPDTPVHDYTVNLGEDDQLNDWPKLKKLIEKEFATYVSVSDKVHIFRQFRQKPTELTRPYYYRITKEYNRFLDDLETRFTTHPDYAGEDDTAKADRRKIIKLVTDFHLMNFFAFGLRPALLEDVTKSTQVLTLEKMVDVASKSEQAQRQSSSRPSTIAEISLTDPLATSPATPAENPTISEDMIIAAIRKFNNQKKSSNAKKNTPNVSCFYCSAAGHKANVCRKRARDRQEGIWRQKISDPAMTKADWEKAVQASKVSSVNATPSSQEDQFYEYFAKN